MDNPYLISIRYLLVFLCGDFRDDNNGCLSRACVRVNMRGVPIADADYVIDVPGCVFLYYKSKMPT